MKIGTTASWLLAIVIPTSLLARADDNQNSPKSPERTPDYCKLSDYVGAKIAMYPSSESVDKAAKDNDTAKRPTGKIDDILVDSCCGSACWSVVTFDKTLGFGGKTVAVPCDQLEWNANDKRFDLRQSDDQLKALPSFDISDARKNGFDSTVANLKSYWPNSKVNFHDKSGASIGDRDTRNDKDNDRNKNAGNNDTTANRDTQNGDKSGMQCPPITIDGDSYTCAGPELVLASDLYGTPVYARNEKFGKVDTTIVDRANHQIAYFVVSHGGTLGVGASDIILPVKGICLHQNGKKLAYSVDRSVAELGSGVNYHKPDHGVLDLEQARRADEMFGKDIQKRSQFSHS